ncbi:MAG: hypothetical protein AAGA09_03265 [Pseudomonadota bacterium]
MQTLDRTVPGRKLAAIVAFSSLPFAVITQVLLGMASAGNTNFLFESHELLSLPADRANAFYWGLWFDPFGYYLIYIPVIIYAWKALRQVDETIADMSSSFGVVYCLLGTYGAMHQAGAYEALQAGYATATSLEQSAAAAAWDATVGGQVRGLWLMEAFFAAVWMTGVGKLLMTAGKKALGASAMIIGAAWFGQWIFASLDVLAVSNVMMALVVLAAPFWTVWLGVTLWRA